MQKRPRFAKYFLPQSSRRKTASRRQHCVQRKLFTEPLEDRRLMAVIDLATLAPGQGTTIFGAGQYDNSGYTVSTAGDVNGDGFDDLIIGAALADGLNSVKTNSGQSYVIFGGATPAMSIDLAALGTAGITIFGSDQDDGSGSWVSGAGDVNGDGFDDLFIGALGADAEGNRKTDAGESYLVFGKAVWTATPTLDLANLRSDGITFFGVDAEDRSGQSVHSAGDVNGDGFDDLLIGATRADDFGHNKFDAGESYLIFGKADWSSTPSIDLGNLGLAGVTIYGAESFDRSGNSVNSVGDVNGDGFDDLVIGARHASSPHSSFTGVSYLVFGKADWSSTATIHLENFGSTGTAIIGGPFDLSGESVSSAGDVNGDGFDDLIMGVPNAGSSFSRFGTAYAGESDVIFGKSKWPESINRTGLSSNGIVTVLVGLPFDRSGSAVSSAGDVNGDGYDDMIIGAPGDAPGSPPYKNAGTSYVVFGNGNFSTNVFIRLSTLGSGGITIIGANSNDLTGKSVSKAGDLNGDGFDDLIVGAKGAAGMGSGKPGAGRSYVIYGSNSFSNSVLTSNLGTSESNRIDGTDAVDIINGAGGDDSIVGNGGADVLTGGQGNDILAVRDLTFRRIVGGTGHDTLRLDGSGMSLDLTAIPDNRILDIERLDISGNGDNQLTLNVSEVLNLSSSTNTLDIQYNEGDSINYGAGWSIANPEMIGSVFVHVIQQRAASIHIFNSIPYQNPLNRFDSSFDGVVSPIDVLMVINALAREGLHDLTVPVSASQIANLSSFRYYDVTGDNVLSPLDVLHVINYLSRRSISSGEGEMAKADDLSVPIAVRTDELGYSRHSLSDPLIQTNLDRAFAELEFDKSSVGRRAIKFEKMVARRIVPKNQNDRIASKIVESPTQLLDLQFDQRVLKAETKNT